MSESIEGDRPEGWVRARLSDVAEVRLGRQRSPKNHNGANMRPYLRAANVTWEGLDLSDVKEMHFSEDEVARYRLQPGDVLVNEASGSATEVGKPARWQGEIVDCCFQNTLIRVRPGDGLDSRFVEHRIRYEALRGGFARGSRGVGIHHLSAGTLAEWPIEVPPLAEQRRLVACLDQMLSHLDSAVVTLGGAHRRLNRLRDAVLGAAVCGELVAQDFADEPAEMLLKRIVEDGRAEGAEPLEAVRPPFEELPSGWVWTSLDAIAEAELGKMLNQQAREGQGQSPYLANFNVRWGSFDLSHLRTMAIPGDKRERYRVRPGDLLVCEGGEVGRCAVWSGELDEVYYQKALHRVRPHAEVSSRYLGYVLRAYSAMGAFEQLTTGSTIKHLPREDLRRLPIPLPPKSEQRRVVDEADRRLSIIDAAEGQVAGGLQRAETLRNSLLHAAFTGRLVTPGRRNVPSNELGTQNEPLTATRS